MFEIFGVQKLLKAQGVQGAVGHTEGLLGSSSEW